MAAANGLTPQQLEFVNQYAISSNATNAYLLAFPHITNRETAKNGAARLLKNDVVRSAIAKITKKSSIKTQITQELVLNNLKMISDRCLRLVPVLVKRGKTKVQDEEQHKCKNCGAAVPVGVFKFDANGANKANELLGRYMAMFTDKVEHTERVSFEQYVLDRKKRKLTELKGQNN